MRCIPDEIDKVLSVAAVIAARNLRTVVRGKTIFRLGGFGALERNSDPPSPMAIWNN
jgi:hypothetical protein